MGTAIEGRRCLVVVMLGRSFTMVVIIGNSPGVIVSSPGVTLGVIGVHDRRD
jgi:hypothetical protein